MFVELSNPISFPGTVQRGVPRVWWISPISSGFGPDLREEALRIAGIYGQASTLASFLKPT
jgi:hypothetical protein